MEITGVFYDVAAYRKMVRDFYGPLKSEILKNGTEKFTFLNENNVLWSYSGALTATYKDGKQEVYDPFGMTMLFKKANDKWKVVFLQESTQAPQAANQ
jgi:ketosteroid isomerase-like protein